MQLRLMTYNILVGGEERTELLLDVIRTQRPDVLALPTTVSIAPAATDSQFEGGFLDAQALAGLCRFNFFGNLTGLPAASVR